MYKVLLVEDEEMIRTGLRYTYDWMQAGCLVIGEAANGQEGLRQIREFAPDIVIADINMPILGGIEMIEQAGEEADCSYIIISGYNEFQLAKQAIHLGVTEYLLKPLDPDQLRDALERAKHQVEMKRNYDAMRQKSDDPADGLNLTPMQLPTKASRYVARMIEYVQEHYAEKIGMGDLVEELDISSTYLNRKFKSETTYTFNDFLNRYRVQQAMERLKRGEGKVYTIATEVGFRDYKYFISIFKKYARCTPGQFQERFGHPPQAVDESHK
ncbi:response regulator transcription factor [Paenibacillus daejeonensis]|uniref:response regulator transcription factor n=1 Tax=Paenibacillus daejeonensis TaxID=135193 RepID=UPI00035D56E9|nr:response regulator [Paenibacillus daejeonensis]